MTTIRRPRRGAMRNQIQIVNRVKVSDGGGNFDVTESTVATVQANIFPVSAPERLRSEKITMEATHRVEMDYYSGLSNDYIIKYGSRRFEIISIVNASELDQRHDLLVKEYT